ncbi:hypothetical protein STENM223S_04753 [Streptomyces tendae]
MIGTVAASAKLQPLGIGATIRSSATATGPKAPANMPSTRSPGATEVTSAPVSVITPSSQTDGGGVARVHAERGEDVTEVDAGCAHRIRTPRAGRAAR